MTAIFAARITARQNEERGRALHDDTPDMRRFGAHDAVARSLLHFELQRPESWQLGAEAWSLVFAAAPFGKTLGSLAMSSTVFQVTVSALKHS